MYTIDYVVIVVADNADVAAATVIVNVVRDIHVSPKLFQYCNIDIILLSCGSLHICGTRLANRICRHIEDFDVLQDQPNNV